MSAPGEFEEALRAVARHAAPDLLEEVLGDSRRQAADLMRDRLTAAMVHEMETLLGAADERHGSLRRGHEEPVTSVARPASRPLRGWYVYGLTWEHTARSLQIAAGVDDAPVEVVAAGSLAAVVSPVSSESQWGASGAGEIDLDQLAPRARKHEWVLEEMLERGAVVPLRFGVLYPDLNQLEETLIERAPDLADLLRRLDGQREWGLTVTADDGVCGQAAALDVAPAGREYLSRRREERLAAERQAEEKARAAEALHHALSGVATDAVIHRATGRQGRQPGVVLRASYLVPLRSEDAFRAAAETELSAKGSVLQLAGELTGPWPPYNFCDVSLEEIPA